MSFIYIRNNRKRKNLVLPIRTDWSLFVLGQFGLFSTSLTLHGYRGSGYIRTKPDKFENATFLWIGLPSTLRRVNLKTQLFFSGRCSVHTKTAFSVTENWTFWKCSPKWIIWKRRLGVSMWTAKTGTFLKQPCDLCRNLFSAAFQCGQRNN